MKEKLLISFSGGRTSAYMTKLILDRYSDKFDIKVLFANTGKEREETYQFTKLCDENFGFPTVWLEAIINPESGKGVQAKEVDFYSAERDGKIFEEMIKKFGIPNLMFMHCTRVLKTQTMEAYLRSIGWKKYYRAIGIRSDEMDRVNAKWKKQRIVYPLISWIPTTKLDVNEFWLKQSFDLQLKSYEGNWTSVGKNHRES